MKKKSKRAETKRKSSDGKALERLVELLQLAFASDSTLEVCRNHPLTDAQGLEVVLDVVVRAEVHGVPSVLVFECKDYATPVKKGYVEEFAKRCETLPVDQKVIVSRKGFQSGAKIKAKAFNIKLVRISEALDPDAFAREILGSHIELVRSIRLQEVRVRFSATQEFRSLNRPILLIDRKSGAWVDTASFAQYLLAKNQPPCPQYNPAHWQVMEGNIRVEAGRLGYEVDDKLFLIHSVDLAVNWIWSRPVFASGVSRLTFDADGLQLASIAAFEQPAVGGTVTIAKVGTGKGGCRIIIKSPDPTAFRLDTHVALIEFISNADFRVRRVGIPPREVRRVEPNQTILDFDSGRLPKDVVVTRAELVPRDAIVPFKWWWPKLTATVDDGTQFEVEIGNMILLPGDTMPRQALVLAAEGILLNPPPYWHLIEGERKRKPFTATIVSGTTIMRHRGHSQRLITLRGEVEYWRSPVQMLE